VQDSYIVTVVR